MPLKIVDHTEITCKKMSLYNIIYSERSWIRGATKICVFKAYYFIGHILQSLSCLLSAAETVFV